MEEKCRIWEWQHTHTDGAEVIYVALLNNKLIIKKLPLSFHVKWLKDFNWIQLSNVVMQCKLGKYFIIKSCLGVLDKFYNKPSAFLVLLQPQLYFGEVSRWSWATALLLIVLWCLCYLDNWKEATSEQIQNLIIFEQLTYGRSNGS